MIDEQNKTWSDRSHLLWWPITFTKYRVENQRLYIRRPDFCQHMRKNAFYTELWMSPMRELSETESLAPERSALPQRMPQIQ